MKNISFKKQNKKIKITLKTLKINENFSNKILIVKGPLGSVTYTFQNQINYNNNKLFIEDKYLNFFINKVNKLIKSVTSG